MNQPITPPTLPKSTEWPAEIECTPEEYLAHYAAEFYEYANGKAIKMSPIHTRHNQLTRYLLRLFDSYNELHPIGKIENAPFVMELPELGKSREPDIQIILDTNPGHYTPTAMIGPADICIEIVSPESMQRDYTEKLEDYEKGGVGEYWILDHLRRDARFYRQAERTNPNDPPLFVSCPIDADGNYRTPALPGLVLHVPALWRDPLPGVAQTYAMVEAMLKSE